MYWALYCFNKNLVQIHNLEQHYDQGIIQRCAHNKVIMALAENLILLNSILLELVSEFFKHLIYSIYRVYDFCFITALHVNA